MTKAVLLLASRPYADGVELGGVGQPWTPDEIDVALESYFRMLRKELAGESFVKKTEISYVHELTGRSLGSVEFKFGNVSGALLELHAPFIRGYKPYRNMQVDLRTATIERWDSDQELQSLAATALLIPAAMPIPDLHWQFNVGEVPEIELGTATWKPKQSGTRTDFTQVEASNKSLGLAGELATVEYEKRRLTDAGHSRLAKAVEHVSKTKGDGLGYDVLSFDTSGNERFIEVKTTRQASTWPFFLSRNELSFSQAKSDQFHLYRLYAFKPKHVNMYQLQGNLELVCNLTPTIFKAFPHAGPM